MFTFRFLNKWLRFGMSIEDSFGRGWLPMDNDVSSGDLALWFNGLTIDRECTVFKVGTMPDWNCSQV